MNIFYLSQHPGEAAQSLCDCHLRKMILETLQLLQTTDILKGKTRPWKKFGENHPCRKSLENKHNYSWLKIYLNCLLEEYEYRFDKQHSCTKIRDDFYQVGLFEKILTLVSFREETFPQVMPVQFQRTLRPGITMTVFAYREYYKFKKKELKKKNMWKYTKRKEPSWLQ